MRNQNGAIEIENLDAVLRKYANMENDLSKAAQKAVRAGMSAVNRDIKRAAPTRFRHLVSASAKQFKGGRLWGRAGFRNKKELAGHQGKDPAFDWFKAYWKNYGTLKKRAPDSVHRFDNPIRPDGYAASQRRRNREGQKAELFFDNAVKGWDQRFLKTFKDNLKKQGYPVDD